MKAQDHLPLIPKGMKIGKYIFSKPLYGVFLSFSGVKSMSCYDCRLCVYYTWEPSLLCAVDPITAERGDAANCRDFQLDNFIVDGVVVKEVVVDDYYDTTVQYGFGPYNLFGGYGIAVPINGWQNLTCEVQCFIYESTDFLLQQGEFGVTVQGDLLWQDPAGRLTGYAEAWEIDHKRWWEDEYDFWLPLVYENGRVYMEPHKWVFFLFFGYWAPRSLAFPCIESYDVRD